MFDPFVAVIGCSNSHRIALAYLNVSVRGAIWNAAQGGYALNVWATERAFTEASTGGASTDPFDVQLAERGDPTAVWFPICVQASHYHGNDRKQKAAAWQEFLAFHSLLRQRTAAGLYVTDTIGDQPSCATDSDVLQEYVAARAVTEGLARRSEPDIPDASHPIPPANCHFDPVLSTNVGYAAAAFLDG